MSNAQLYARHPIQIDAVTVIGRHHIYLRDTKKTLYPNKPAAWPKLVDGTYLCAMSYTFGDDEKSSYIVEGARQLKPTLALPLNRELYDILRLRDAADADISEDPLHLEALGWIFNTPYDGTRLRRQLQKEHGALLDQYQETGVMPKRMSFVASQTIDFVDVLLELGAKPEDLEGANWTRNPR